MTEKASPGGNTTTAGAVEQLELARRIASAHIQHRAPQSAERILRGESDAYVGVQVALAAISETTEAAAKLADAAAAGNRRREAQYRESAENDPSTAGEQVDMETAVAFAKMASGSSALAASLRNNDHLKGHP